MIFQTYFLTTYKTTYKRYLSHLMRKPTILYAKPKAQIRFAVTAMLISPLFFVTRIVQSYLYPKFQSSSILLCLCSSFCVGPFWKPQCWFSHNAAHLLITYFQFALLETTMTCIQDEYPKLRKYKSYMCVGFGVVLYLLALPCVTPVSIVMH